MAIFKYKTINISYGQCPTEYLGDLVVRVPKYLVEKVVELAEFDDLVEEFSYHIDNTPETSITDLYNADDFIALLYVLTENGVEGHIDVCYDHPIWLFHDISHAANDVDPLKGVIVDAGRECRAWEDAVRVTEELDIPMPFNILKRAEKAFLNRFGVHIGLVDMPENQPWYLYENRTVEVVL